MAVIRQFISHVERPIVLLEASLIKHWRLLFISSYGGDLFVWVWSKKQVTNWLVQFCFALLVENKETS